MEGEWRVTRKPGQHSALILACGFLLSACGSDDISVSDPATYVLRFDVVAEGNTRKKPSTDASIFLARSNVEAQRIALWIGIEEAADSVRSWTRYRDRSLIALVGRSMVEEGSRLEVDLVEGPALTDEVVVTAHTVPLPELAPDVPSVPWTVVSVSTARVIAANECVLLIDELELTSRCPAIDT
jgi:hypothetical protein